MTDPVYVIYVLVECLAAAYFIWLGARILIAKRPLLLAARQSTIVLIGLVLLPLIILVRVEVSITLFYLAADVIIIITLWVNARGYAFLGITDETMLDAVHSALKAINLPYEERLGQLLLPSINAELQIAVQGWMGAAQIVIKPDSQQAVLDAIAAAMREYFRQGTSPINRFTPIAYVVLGIFIALFVAYFVIFMRGS